MAFKQTSEKGHDVLIGQCNGRDGSQGLGGTIGVTVGLTIRVNNRGTIRVNIRGTIRIVVVVVFNAVGIGLKVLSKPPEGYKGVSS
jgi:hypothetical protein